MSDATFHTTHQDLRKAESKLSQKNNGNVPADSEPSQMKSLLAQTPPKSKSDLIDARKAALPLPDQPPVPSDWNSSDATKVNVGSGGVQSDVSYGAGSESGLRGPATVESGVRGGGEGFRENAGGSGEAGT